MKAQSSKTYRMQKSSSKRKSYSDTVSPQEGRKITDLRKPNVILKGPEKEQAKLRGKPAATQSHLRKEGRSQT